jgi:murein DD-endopeptidase MepM/ murein hydrolase activator NlpD
MPDLSGYHYAYNDPIGNIDKDGLSGVGVLGQLACWTGQSASMMNMLSSLEAVLEGLGDAAQFAGKVGAFVNVADKVAQEVANNQLKSQINGLVTTLGVGGENQPHTLSNPVNNPTIRPTSGNKNKSRFVDNPNFVPRIDKVTKKIRNHYGIDITAKSGTPLKSITDGNVVSTGSGSGFGNMIIIKGHDENGKVIYVLYAHLSKIEVREGQNVNTGDEIGLTGATGNAAGLPPNQQHVHIEVSTTSTFKPGVGGKGTRIDPEKIIPTKFDKNGNLVSTQQTNENVFQRVWRNIKSLF